MYGDFILQELSILEPHLPIFHFGGGPGGSGKWYAPTASQVQSWSSNRASRAHRAVVLPLPQREAT